MRIAHNIDDVILILDDIIAEHRDRRSTMAYFPAMYRAVTVRVREGIAAGRFADGDRMNRFDTAFANRYFVANDTHRAGEKPTRAWHVAFGVEARPGIMALQHLLLGMNAHINLDLPIAALEVGEGAMPDLKDDFMAINGILQAALDPVQATLDGLSPVLAVLDRVGGRTDEQIVNFSIVAARDEAWHEANRLALEGPVSRQKSIDALDRRVKVLSERIIVPGGPVGLAIELIAMTENRDVPTVVDALLKVH